MCSFPLILCWAAAFAAAVPTADADGAKAVDLDEKSFGTLVGSKPWCSVVLFHSPFCPHCLHFMPTFDDFATDALVGHNANGTLPVRRSFVCSVCRSPVCVSLMPMFVCCGPPSVGVGQVTVVVAKVNTVTHNALAAQWKVRGVPTVLVWLPASAAPLTFGGARTKAALLDFLRTALAAPPPPDREPTPILATVRPPLKATDGAAVGLRLLGWAAMVVFDVLLLVRAFGGGGVRDIAASVAVHTAGLCAALLTHHVRVLGLYVVAVAALAVHRGSRRRPRGLL